MILKKGGENILNKYSIEGLRMIEDTLLVEDTF